MSEKRDLNDSGILKEGWSPLYESNCGTCGELLETVNSPEGHKLYHGGDCFDKRDKS